MDRSSQAFVAALVLRAPRHRSTRTFPRACAAVSPENPNVVTNEVYAHPGYQVYRAPHLRDYLHELGAGIASPLLKKRLRRAFVEHDHVILGRVLAEPGDKTPVRAFTRAGPREQVYFGGVRAAIVSCGGICPGINTVIREITLCLHQYDVSAVFGVQHGYRGFSGEHWKRITRDDVEGMHKVGGTMLGSSRGGFDLQRIVDAIETRSIDQLYVIGGDGTIMGCQQIFREVQRRKLKTSVISIPKTIDNDVPVIDRTFGMYNTLLILP